MAGTTPWSEVSCDQRRTCSAWPGLFASPTITLTKASIVGSEGGHLRISIILVIMMLKNTSAKENRGGKETARNVNETENEG